LLLLIVRNRVFLSFYIICFSGDTPKSHNVVWDTSPVKTRHWVLESLPDVGGSLVPEDFTSDLRLVNREERKQLGGVYVRRLSNPVLQLINRI